METITANPLYRKKIANWQSYPLGAEAISSALADVPQYSRLAVAFHDDYSRRGAVDSRVYRVLRLSYRRLSNAPPSDKPANELGWFDRNWEIEVNPIPRIRRHLIKGQLLNYGLPEVRQWLLRHATHRMGRESLELIFSEDTEKLSLKAVSHLEPEVIR